MYIKTHRHPLPTHYYLFNINFHAGKSALGMVQRKTDEITE